VIAHEAAEFNIAVINLDPGAVLTETMELTLQQYGNARVGREMTSPVIPAKAIAHLCSLPDAMRYSGEIVYGETLYDEFGLS
jgi:NAD(P)-dependent dehydrogenase (short-subunit alcohol dehydrogenase family)